MCIGIEVVGYCLYVFIYGSICLLLDIGMGIDCVPSQSPTVWVDRMLRLLFTDVAGRNLCHLKSRSHSKEEAKEK